MVEALTIDDLVSPALTQRFDGAMGGEDVTSVVVTKIVVIAEVLGSNGERYLQYLRPTEQPVWDCLGMVAGAAAEWQHQLVNQDDE